MTHGEFWAAMGLSDLERDLYGYVVRQPGASLAYLSEVSAQDAASVYGVVERLADLGLVRWSDQAIEAVDPLGALSTLARHRQSSLDQVQIIAGTLLEEFQAARRVITAEPRLQTVAADKVSRLVVDTLDSARRTIDAVVAPPVVTDATAASAEYEALRRGVQIRSLMDASFDTDAFLAANAMTAYRLGEQIRTLPGLTSKVLIIDGERFIFPVASTADQRLSVDAESDEQAYATVGNDRAFTALLSSLFDTLWARSTPFAPPVQRSGKRPAPQNPFADILDLLELGLDDASIARRLRVSERTVRRRMSRLLRIYGVDTRFQLGMAVEAQKSALAAGQRTAPFAAR